jgi:2-polyprenyl-3-methyl-5-hydroxy-6-metoxy-1,4-benzoquinol methylase
VSTDEDWQLWGRRNPYFGVITDERFVRDKLTPESLDEFFRVGKAELCEILADCNRHLGEVTTRRSLDFGCGVGRLLIPLAEVSEYCVGVDVSDAMREETARNCEKFGRTNVRLVRSLEQLAAREEPFTFIHCYIVLQHIDPERGLGIIASLLQRLERGGAAALHVTYARAKYPRNFGALPLDRRIAREIRTTLSRLTRRFGEREPQMQMNSYNMNRVLFLAQQYGVRSGGFRFTNHAGHLGAILFLKRD